MKLRATISLDLCSSRSLGSSLSEKKGMKEHAALYSAKTARHRLKRLKNSSLFICPAWTCSSQIINVHLQHEQSLLSQVYNGPITHMAEINSTWDTEVQFSKDCLPWGSHMDLTWVTAQSDRKEKSWITNTKEEIISLPNMFSGSSWVMENIQVLHGKI